MILNKQTHYILVEWLSFMKRNNYNYCLFKNHKEFVEGRLDGNDFDIIVDKKNFDDIENKLFQLFKDGYTIIPKNKTEYIREYWVIDFENNQLFIIDINFLFIVMNDVLIDAKEIFQNTILKNDIFTVNNTYEFKINMLLIIYKNKFKKKYINNLIQNELSNDELKSILSHKNMTQLINFYNKFYNKNIKGRNRSRIYIMYKKVKEKMVFKKPIFVVLLGPDGAGKSTIGHELEKKMLQLEISTDYFHYGKGKESLNDNESVKVEKRNNPSKIKELLPLSIYQLLLKLKVEVKFIKKFVKNNKNYLNRITLNKKEKRISIVDRFPLNSCINKIKLKYQSIIRYLLGFLVYKPRKIYFLHADAKIIRQRKKELTINEINNLMKYEIQLIKKKNIDYKVIDASNEISKITNEIIEDVINSFPKEINKYVK